MAYAEGADSVSDDEISITQEGTLRDLENADPSGSGISDEEDAEPSDPGISDEEDAYPSAEQSFEENRTVQEDEYTVESPVEEDSETGPAQETANEPMDAEPVAEEITTTDDGEITTWEELQTAFSAGGSVTLTRDVMAVEGDEPLKVSAGKTVTLDLNGHTLGLSRYSYEIIHVYGGTLIINGDGTIKGDNKCAHGIVAESYGTVTMNGGTITEVSGDGIYLDGGATLVMNGGAIRNCGDTGVETSNANFTMNGGEITGSGNDGLYIYQSNFTMNGGEISGSWRYDLYFDSNDFHLSGGTVSDAIYLTNNIRIIIDSELDPDACFPILMETNGKFTFGLNGKGDISNFRSAEEGYTVALNEQGEAMLVQSGTVVPYVERSWDGEKIVSKKTTRNNGQWQPFPESANITSGWYYLDRDVTKNGRVESITGDVDRILGDGHTLDVKGLYVPAGSTLTIYGQSDGENGGKICSQPGKSQGGAGIGGYSGHDNGNIVIHGGIIEAKGYDYCAAAQIFFEYHHEGLTLSSAVDAVTAETLSGYIAVREGELPEGVSIGGVSAMLESDNTFRLYLGFKGVSKDDFHYFIDGEPATPGKRADGMYYLALEEGVYSNRLQDTHTYTVSTGEVPDSTNSYTITASVLTYARSCAVKKGTSEDIENTRNLGKALYLYNRAAVAAFGE